MNNEEELVDVYKGSGARMSRSEEAVLKGIERYIEKKLEGEQK